MSTDKKLQNETDGLMNLKEAIRDGFNQSPKSIPPRFLYDERGSKLFKEICELEEYYLTNTELKILNQYQEQILGKLPSIRTVVEFGSGDSEKTRFLLKALLNTREELTYLPVDIDPAILDTSTKKLRKRFKRLETRPIHGTYYSFLERMNDYSIQGPCLFLFLGSSIGNMKPDEAVEFTRKVAESMDGDDKFFVGYDLWKDPEILYRAYNDSQGLTAQFNKNLLRRINRELNADFDLDEFHHRARVQEVPGRVEMHLVSESPQKVHVKELDRSFEFSADEYIHTEDSYKYTSDEFRKILDDGGLEPVKEWTDENNYFSNILLEKQT